MNKNLPKIGILLAAFVVINTGIFYALSESPAPAEFKNAVPFTTQAPNGNWEGNESCEETSAIMAYHFFKDDFKDNIPAETASKEIKDLITWENENLKYNENTGAEATAQVVENNFPLKTEVIKDFTAEQFKKALSKKQLILLPLNAQFLAPDNYPDLHPTYHMVIIHSYDKDRFYLNDPGTSTGFNNGYTFEELQKATTDWNQEFNKMEPEKKVALLVYPK